MRRSTSRVLGLVLAAAAWGSIPSWAASPTPFINFQGVLRDAGGQPITGSVDMAFLFYDAPSGGVDILVDRHSAAALGAVPVTNGLFDVLLGNGVVQDGSGPGIFNNLSDVFRDYSSVWMEVYPGADPAMTPRIRIAASAYAHNADYVDGLDAAQLLRSDASSNLSAGTLTIGPSATLDVNGTLALDGSLKMKDSGPDATQSIFFLDAGNPTAEALQWRDGTSNFGFSDSLGVAGILRVGDSAISPGLLYNWIGDGAGSPSSGNMYTVADLFVEGSIELDGNLDVGDRIHFNAGGPEAFQIIGFFEDGSDFGELIAWVDASDSFAISDDLDLEGALTASGALSGSNLTATGTTRLGSSTESSSHLATIENVVSEKALRLIGPGTPYGYQARLNFGDGDYAYIDESTDDTMRIRGNAGVGINGAPAPYAGSLQVFGDTVVNGNLFATGAKPFVQNHPQHKDLSVVYVALEGDEAGTYTRGSGRLQGGEAHVRLGETYAFVTSPDTGLTAQITPRGEWADLYVASLSTTELVVRARDGSSDVAFDYFVQGLRIGYERFPVVQTRTVDARVPSDLYYEAHDPSRPATGGHTAMARFTASESVGGGAVPAGGAAPVRAGGGAGHSAAALALRQGIGEFDEQPYALRPPSQDEKMAAARLAASSPGTGGPQAASGSDVSATPARLSPALATGVATPVAVAPASARSIPVDAEGNVYARSFRPSARDLASLVPVSGRVEPGDVLSIDPDLPGVMTLAREAGDARVFGIVAEAPGVVLGSPGPGGSTTRDAAVAFSGVTLCKVDADLGAIQAGDLLVTSSTPGHAMRSDNPRPGTILGKALEPLEAGTGLITVLVILR